MTGGSWSIAGVEALPQPWYVYMWNQGRREWFEAPALLLEENQQTGETRVVFGVVNPQRGTVDPVDPNRGVDYVTRKKEA